MCQLISKPADQNNFTSESDVNHHCLTHISIISPVLQKTCFQYHKLWKDRRLQIKNYGKCSILGIVAFYRCIWICTEFRRLRKFTKSNYSVLPLCVSIGPLVNMEQLGSEWTDFLKAISWEFVKNLLWKFNFNENLTIITVTLHKDICSFMIMSRSTLLTINDSVKVCSENHSTHFIFNNFFQNVPLWGNV